jgi:L-ascorbate metabolism protein UlaG (beta-lactamase superfamily)
MFTVRTAAVLVLAATLATSAHGRQDAHDLVITPLVHSSLQIEHGETVVLIDPWLRGDLTRVKQASLILITDDVGHHLDPAAISRFRRSGAPVVGPASVRAAVPDAVVLSNGESGVFAGVGVESTAAYDLTPGAPEHPKGEANGYVLSLGGSRILIAGVTECVPEIRALRDIDVAFMPMNIPPQRMAPAVVAACTRAINPRVVYVYHYDQTAAQRLTRGEPLLPDASIESTLDAFGEALKGSGIEFRRPRWY